MFEDTKEEAVETATAANEPAEGNAETTADADVCPKGLVPNPIVNGRPKFYYRSIWKYLKEHQGELTYKEESRLANMALAQGSISRDIYTKKSLEWEFPPEDWEAYVHDLREDGLTELADANAPEEDKKVCALIFGRACHGVNDVTDFNPALKRYFEIPYEKYCPDNRTEAERAADNDGRTA